jgi:hypothetical protein
MQNEVERGEKVDAGEVEDWLVNLLSAVTVRLHALPAKTASEAHSAQSIAECEAVVRRHLNEILEEIADAKWIKPPRKPRKAKAA